MEKNIDKKYNRVIESLAVVSKYADDPEYKQLIDKLLQDNRPIESLSPDYLEQLLYLQEKEKAYIKEKTR